MWGIKIPVAWGFAIINLVWWIGIGHAGTPISAILLCSSLTMVLVVLHFVHVRYASGVTWLFAGAGLLWLLTLVGLTLSDYLSRDWLA